MKSDQDLHCSPYNQKKYGIKDGTCYSLEDLKVIAKEYNRLNNKHKIDIDVPKEVLHKELESAFKNVCATEFCWVDNEVVSNHQLKERVKDNFRPQKPLEWYDDKRTWLNTYDILFVMEQYEKLYKDFAFLGVFPMDFAQKDERGYCIGETLCSFNINTQILKNKKKRFAFVINLDYHDEPGSHWVSVYCSLDPKKKNFGIYYYDSVANEPTEEVQQFMERVKKQAVTHFKKTGSRFQTSHNEIQKQFKDSECGVFSIIFLTQCLKNVPFEKICKNMRTDDEINKLRDIIYTPKNSKRRQSHTYI